MTDESGSEPPEGEGPDGTAAESGSPAPPRARAPWERKDPNGDEVKHSALVGFMSVPMGRRFPIRRSTFVMAVAFIGLATLLYFNPPEAATNTGSGFVLHTSQGDVFVPNATAVSTTTTTTTPPAATTTTAAPSPTTTVFSGSLGASTTTSTSTTTTRPTGGGAATTTTTTTSAGSTGTNGFGSASTSTSTSTPR